MFTIENQELKVSIDPKGAELQNLYSKNYELEYMWDGDPAFWGKHSPLLFPIVGTLKGNTYYYQGKAYSLPRHGFARDREFSVESQRGDSITFLLRSDEQTRAVYPFEFELRVGYRLVSNKVATTYQIRNPSVEPMYFSIGGHPAFRVPLVPGTDYGDYYLEFDGVEETPRWPISKDGLIELEPEPLLQDTAVLQLRKELFAKDALVLKHPISAGVTLRSGRTDRRLRMDFPGFPFLGIWAAPNADFVCIEPWCGIADHVDSNQQWVEKFGINQLEGGGVFQRTWTVSLL
ncbi:MAG TPA: aldose 1-epimerase family protein [Puia sp.]|jgi:galactose mutarotase-like enzyme|nr:aldose 1-epimerase family protein [Puia sp.]